MPGECIAFDQLPGQNPLFLDYLSGKAEQFYPVRPLDLASLLSRAETVLQTGTSVAEPVLSFLSETQERFHPGEAAERNLELLASGGAVAVVTGQQVGVLGGPALSVYKALTAVLIAKRLTEAGSPAVPIFWLAGDDSDFEEVRSTLFHGKEGLFEVSFRSATARPGQMVGTVALEEPCELLKQIHERSAESRFSPQVFEWIEKTLDGAVDFRSAFARWIGALFKDDGLILFDPLHQDFHSGLGDFFATAVRQRRAIVERLLQRSTALREAGYRPQVRVEPDETLLFWVDGRVRHKLRFDGSLFRARGRTDIELSGEELLDKIEAEPGQVSWSALLRPIVQDILLPTAVYVGGPAEVAYFSQVNSIAEFWNIDTVIVPRIACTLLNRKVQRLLEKYSIDWRDVLLRDRKTVAARCLRNGDPGDLLRRFDQMRASWEKELVELEENLKQQDRSVADMLANAREKIFYHLDKVSNRFISNSQSQNRRFDDHINYLWSLILPEGELQERKLNFNSFLLDEGLALKERLEVELDPCLHSHQVLFL